MRLTRDQLPVKTTLLQNSASRTPSRRRISYQSKRRCSKTLEQSPCRLPLISYQSKRRCSKTGRVSTRPAARSVTSQNDAAPKLDHERERVRSGSVTSQNDAAPKLVRRRPVEWRRSVTSQNDAAPKPLKHNPAAKDGRFDWHHVSNLLIIPAQGISFSRWNTPLHPAMIPVAPGISHEKTPAHRVLSGLFPLKNS